MDQQEKKQIKMYDGKVFGFKVSTYGLKNGYLDYRTLSQIVGDSVLNNNIMTNGEYYEWELVNGGEMDEEDDYYEVYQYYIISDAGASFLEEYTDEIVYYHEGLDMYVWGITHFGTSWDYVLTDIELVGDSYE